jgi:hypothetical protein
MTVLAPRTAASMRDSVRRAAIAVTASCALSIATVPSVASADTQAVRATSLASSLSWKVSARLNLRNSDGKLASFTAVAPTGPGSAWAFLNVSPVAWHLVSGHWSSVMFPDERMIINYAAASGPDNVWAFGLNNTAYRFGGARWVVAHRFGHDDVMSAAVVNSSDVYVITAVGTRMVTWHFNGQSWRMLPGGKNLFLISASSPGNVWAAGVDTVAHLTHGKWHDRRVKSLLPSKYRSCTVMSAVYAKSPGSVWAVDARICGTTIDPTVLLPYTGRHWRVAAPSHAIGYVASTDLTADGSGGVWLATEGDGITSSSLVHFANGKFTTIRRPVRGAYFQIAGLAHEARSDVSYAVGTVSPASGGISRKDHAFVLVNGGASN